MFNATRGVNSSLSLVYAPESPYSCGSEPVLPNLNGNEVERCANKRLWVTLISVPLNSPVDTEDAT